MAESEQEASLESNIKEWFRGWRQPESVDWEEEQAELDRLETSLLSVIPTLNILVERYHVDLGQLLEILREHRFRWCFGNYWRLFQRHPVHELERLPKTLTEAAELLEDAWPLLVAVWGASLQDLHARTGFRRRALQDLTDSLPGLGAANPREAFDLAEELETYLLAADGMSEWHGTPASDLPTQLSEAVAVLRKAADTMKRIDWRRWADKRGRRAFPARGRRPELVAQAGCATALVEYFRAETTRALYDYAGNLLIATFPETCGAWGLPTKARLRDRVKQLLRRQPQQKRDK